MGTPAWVSDSRDGQSHVAKLWFVIITGSKNKPRVRFDPAEIRHDPVSRGVQAASDSDDSSDLTTSAGASQLLATFFSYTFWHAVTGCIYECSSHTYIVYEVA